MVPQLWQEFWIIGDVDRQDTVKLLRNHPSCITFKLFRGDILEGVVHKVLKHGVFLRCGPVENTYLSCLKMPDYKYVTGENPVFLNDKLSKIKKMLRSVSL
ncbi:hypothetical protein CMV_016003 [Castanea mollissima]|uniref:Uncharacterized protein n=1 Tax=Castanea mollissima TaxID=60419 RepID=A0A8J4R8C2_9ROSI|nr:hypothetical protein CMV_016003 [Castanea mollissima]